MNNNKEITFNTVFKLKRDSLLINGLNQIMDWNLKIMIDNALHELTNMVSTDLKNNKISIDLNDNTYEFILTIKKMEPEHE